MQTNRTKYDRVWQHSPGDRRRTTGTAKGTDTMVSSGDVQYFLDLLFGWASAGQ
jgi:hypothetical protein